MTGQQHITIPGAILLGLLAACISYSQEPAAEPEAGMVEPAAMQAADGPVMYDLARYQLIVERQPFGSEPLDQEEKAQAAAVKALEQDYRLCFLLQNESGEVRAGFQNKKPKKGDPRSVMLRIGESFGAMKLLTIDIENSMATLQYKGQEVEFSMEKPKTAAAAAKPAAPKPAAAPQRRFGGGFRRTTPPPAPPPEPEPEPEPQLSPEELAIQREQIQQNLRDYQMEVLRQGMPPLPIQLTQEQDDQLVAEGVLPPLE